VKNKLEIVKVLVGLAFVSFTFTLFVSDFKHTHMFPNDNGELQEMYVNYDFQLKFIAYVLVFLPMLVLTFLRHNLLTKILSLALPLVAISGYYIFSWAFNEDGYFLYDGPTYIGYLPYVGFYLSVGAIFLLFIAGILKALQPIQKLNKPLVGIIDDL